MASPGKKGKAGARDEAPDELVSKLREFAEEEGSRGATLHEVDESVLEPWKYILNVPGKNVRGILVQCFQKWLRIEAPDLEAITTVVEYLHTASLLIDDIEDDSHMRRGVPVAHKIYGVPMTINAANYVYFLAMEKVSRLGKPAAMHVFTEELLNLHRGQGQDILWRDTAQCPTEEQYKTMVLDKTGGLFRLAVKLMACFSECEKDFLPLIDMLALYFQIRDDYINLASDAYMQNKSFCEDLTEGKFSFLIIHAIHSRPDDHRLLNILKQRTNDVGMKKYALQFLRQCGSFEYTREALVKIRDDILAEIASLGGHEQLVTLLLQLDKQLDAGAEASPRRRAESGGASSEGTAGSSPGAAGGAGAAGGPSAARARGDAAGAADRAATAAAAAGLDEDGISPLPTAARLPVGAVAPPMPLALGRVQEGWFGGGGSGVATADAAGKAGVPLSDFNRVRPRYDSL